MFSLRFCDAMMELMLIHLVFYVFADAKLRKIGVTVCHACHGFWAGSALCEGFAASISGVMTVWLTVKRCRFICMGVMRVAPGMSLSLSTRVEVSVCGV